MLRSVRAGASAPLRRLVKGFRRWRGFERKPSYPMKIISVTISLMACVCATAMRANEKQTFGAPAVPGKIHRMENVIYPVTMLREGVSQGEVRVLLNVDSTGKLVDVLPIAYTHEAFLQSALRAIPKWTFEPARLNDEPVGSVHDILMRFEVSGILVVERTGPSLPTRELFGEVYVYKPHGVRSLDAIPTPLHVTPPIYPREWIDQGVRGNATVDFYIDETGTVRMPSIVASDHPLLGAAAAAAVSEWRFDPPLRRGRPVLVHCQQVISFQPEEQTQQ